MDIKYDIPVCYEDYEDHIYIYIYIHIYIFIYIYIYIYIFKLTERIIVLLNAIFQSFRLARLVNV